MLLYPRTCFAILLVSALPALAQDFKTLFNEGQKLIPMQASDLEKKLQASPEDLSVRARLMGYYFRRGADSSHQSRLRHIDWLIEHHSDSPLLYTDVASLSPADFKPPMPGDLKAMVAAWRGQLQAHPDDERVLANAVRGLYQVDFGLTVETLQRLRRVASTNPRWAVLLASLYIATVTGANQSADAADRAPKALADLSSSTDLAVLGVVGQALYSMGRKAQAQPLAEYGESLLKKAQSLDPLNPRWTTNASETPGLLTERDLWPFGKVPAMPVPDGAIRVAPEVQAAKLLRHVPPDCISSKDAVCPQTRTTLKLTALIGKDGRVKSVYATSGDMSTIPSAMDAAREWTYRPTLVNGQPVEVVTEIPVVFTPTKTPVTPVMPKEPVMTPPVVLTQVEPEYSPEARAVKFQGSVQLALVVDERGLPRDIKVIRSVGHGLDEKAIEAVRKWTFRPGMKDGKPVASPVSVDVNFRL